MEISNKREALRLVVRSTNGDIGSYLIFTDRIDLINKLISCVWEEYDEDFVDENEYLQYLNNLIEKSYYNKNIEFNYDSNIITLITCSYEYNNARTIVHAKLSNKI